MKKTLIASKYLPPYPGGSSEIIDRLAGQFTDEEMVVIGEVRWFNRSRRTVKRAPGQPRYYYSASEVSLGGYGMRFFQWLMWLQLPLIVFRMWRIIRREQVEHVIGVFPSAHFCLAAVWAARLTGCSFSSYFHNTLADARYGWNRRFSAYVQDIIFRNSRIVYVMSEGMADFYRRSYPGHRFEPLVHTFPTYYDPPPAPFPTAPPYRLVLIGNMNGSNLDATLRLLRTVGEDDRFQVHLYSYIVEEMLQRRGVDTDRIHFEGYVPADELLPLLAGYDLGVLTHGFTGGYSDVEYETIFPTRTIPLLASGNPLLAHCPADSFIGRILAEYDAAELVTEASGEAILAGLDRLIRDADRRRQLRENGRRMLGNYYGPKVAARLRTLIGAAANG